MITTDNIGFSSADLMTKNMAELYATLSSSLVSNDTFRVSFTKEPGDDFWWFDEDGCREASEFFLTLADELKRRAKKTDRGEEE